MSRELRIHFDSLKRGVFYKSLSKYKKQTEFGSFDDNKLSVDIKRLNTILEKSKKINLDDGVPTKYQINEIPDETSNDDSHQQKNKTQKPR